MDETKTRDQRIAELLDQSAKDAVDGIKGPSLADQFQPVGKTEEADVEGADDDSVGDKKIRIRKSRLNTLEKELEDMRGQLASVSTYQERVATLEAQLAENRKSDDDLPDYWKEAWGDTDVSKKAYRDQQRLFREEMTREFERRESERKAQDEQREEKIREIEQSFDSQMDSLEDSIGRELTDNQKEEIMNIVESESDVYKEEDGRYSNYIPISTAYKIWSSNKPNASKSEMAEIAGLQSSGGSTVSTQSSERPQMGDWRKRFGGL